MTQRLTKQNKSIRVVWRGGERDSDEIKGHREFDSPHTHKLSIRPRQYSLSMAEGWKGLASIRLYSTRTSHVDG